MLNIEKVKDSKELPDMSLHTIFIKNCIQINDFDFY